MIRPSITSLQFFETLRWLDGRPLMDTIEEYRRDLFTKALDTYDDEGVPQYTMVLAGRGKKNNKSTDLVLAALYKLVIPVYHGGNDCLIVANDEGQALDDLTLAKRLVACNSPLQAELDVLSTEIRRRDGLGSLRVLSSRDAIGAHGKTACYLGYDEIHGLRSWDILEALSPDPTRHVMQWITTYDTIFNNPGVPLFDLKQTAIKGEDPRLLFSWYSADLCTDPNFATLAEPELRANPSIASFGRDYLETQRRRLPVHRFKRLHLNLPGAPDGAAFDPDMVMACVVPGRRQLEFREGVRYVAFVDMSGGSRDDAVLAIAHFDPRISKTVLDLIVSQTGSPPFSAPQAVRKFAGILKAWGISRVTGDHYAGDTFGHLFLELGIKFETTKRDKSTLYDSLDPVLTGAACELLDVPVLYEQALTLVVTRSGKIDHQAGDHDDWINAAAGAIWYARPHAQQRIPMIAPPDCSTGYGYKTPVPASAGQDPKNPRPPAHYLKQDDGLGWYHCDPMYSPGAWGPVDTSSGRPPWSRN
jgi:hypothetical protein